LGQILLEGSFDHLQVNWEDFLFYKLPVGF
jgi:hypothetical protein